MITKNIFLTNLLTFILTINFIIPNVYEGLSVSESDNLNALYNPAGLGIDHGWETFIYGTFDQDDFESGTLYFGDKIKGLGYSFGYQKIDKISKPSVYNFGYGTKLKKDLYAGISYNQDQLYQLGILYRPYNFLSSGLKYSSNTDTSIVDFGLAIRPFNSHRITIGADTKFDLEDNLEPTEYSLFIRMITKNGIELTTKFLKNDGNLSNGEPFNSINIDLGFNFGKNNLKTSYNTAEGNEISVGWMKSSHIRENKTKQKPRYVSLVLDDIFIEEKPIIPKFEINLFNLNQAKGTQLRTWIEKIDNLTQDPNVEGLIIYLKNVSAGWGKRNEIRTALKRFKESDKKIIVYSENTISNINYHLISLADEIYVTPLTGVDLRGLKMEVTFYKGLLDSLDITPKVWRISKDGKSYKTAGDPFINTKMSDEMKENYSQLLDDLYSDFITDIAEGRGWLNSKDDSIILASVDSLINNGPYWHHKQALNAGLYNYEKDTTTYLVDGAMYPDEFESYMKSLNDNKIIKFKNKDKETKYDYAWKKEIKPKIAMIYAVGGIISGKSNPGPTGSSIMGDKTIIKAIKNARNDNSIEAIILRIDSGGGSALASDQMWREIYKTTADTSVTNKKPFIASMSDVAASGGYYIACQADTIIAYPTTITGSIGVISMGFNLSDLYQKIGINKEVIKRGEYSDLLTQSRTWTAEEDKLMIESVENYYREFVDRVLQGRPYFNDDRNELDKVAIGRIWSGNEALNNGLIDEVGGINKTVAIAKQMIGLNESDDIEIVEYPLPFDKNSFKNKADSNNELTFILKFMPDEIKKELNDLNIIPILKGEKLYFILPYHIDIH